MRARVSGPLFAFLAMFVLPVLPSHGTKAVSSVYQTLPGAVMPYAFIVLCVILGVVLFIFLVSEQWRVAAAAGGGSRNGGAVWSGCAVDTRCRNSRLSPLMTKRHRPRHGPHGPARQPIKDPPSSLDMASPLQPRSEKH